LHRAPAVKGDFADVVFGAQFFNKGLDKAVMHHVALRRFQKPLLVPDIIGYMIAPHPKRYIFLRNPKVWQHLILVILIHRRKHQHKGGNIGRAG